jgi:hypothetical protein
MNAIPDEPDLDTGVSGAPALECKGVGEGRARVSSSDNDPSRSGCRRRSRRAPDRCGR